MAVLIGAAAQATFGDPTSTAAHRARSTIRGATVVAALSGLGLLLTYGPLVTGQSLGSVGGTTLIADSFADHVGQAIVARTILLVLLGFVLLNVAPRANSKLATAGGRWSVPGIAALVVNLAPARDVVRRPVALTVETATGLVDITVDPAKLGANELHLYALTKQGASRPVEAISATLSNTGAGVERLESRTVRAGPNHLQALSLDLPLAGTWRVDVSVKLDAFTERADERRSPFADPGLVPCEPSRRVPGRHHPTSAVRASQTSCFGPRNGQKHRMWDGEHRHVGFRARLLMPGTPLETGIRRPTQRAVASSHALG